MGSELLCKVRSGGKEASGKALLETNEIIFRGDMRLKIPFASLKSVVARDGELHLNGPRARRFSRLVTTPRNGRTRFCIPRARRKSLASSLDL